MQEYAKHMLSTFYYAEYLQEKKFCFRRNRAKKQDSLKESPRGGMLVRNKNILDEK